MERLCKIALAVLCAGVSLLVGAVAAPHASQASALPPARYFAPYVQLSETTRPWLSKTAATPGQKYWTLAFVVARSPSQCRAVWDGARKLAFSVADVQALRGQGGDVVISFGGQGTTELAQACTSLSALEAQYEAVITTYGVTSIDLDVEGKALDQDSGSISRRNHALAYLQNVWAPAQGLALQLSYTLPVQTTGLTPNGLALLRDAVSNGVHVSRVNILAMDYGKSDLPNPAGQMGAAAITASRSTFAKLAGVWPSYTPSQLWSTIGITPEIGLNDTAGEVFAQAEARQVLAFAQSQGVGLLSFWAATRDLPCPHPSCSGVAQAPYEFTGIFRPFS